MTPMVILLIVVVGAAALFGLFVIGLYNNLQRRRIAADGAWSDVDVQLKRRYDLIPNLVETVKGYASHEKGTLEAVIAARQGAVNARGVAEQAQADNMVTQALGKLFALSEAYPDLKANTNFMALQEELTSTENKVGFSRQNYNRNASQYNEAMVVFPGNIVAGMFGFRPMEFFELADATQRNAPQVKF